MKSPTVGNEKMMVMLKISNGRKARGRADVVEEIEILYYRCKHENNVLTLVVGSSFLLSPASEKGKCILWVSDFY